MKKVIVLFCVLAMLLSLAGCQLSTPQSQDPEHGPLTMTPGENYTDFENIEIRVESLDRHEEEGKTTLTVVWNNKSEFDAIYGSSYLIERLEGEEWVSCAMRDDLIFTAIAYNLDAGSVRNETYHLTNTFDVSSPGNYRFKTECYVYETAEESTKCRLVAEFSMDSQNNQGGV